VKKNTIRYVQDQKQIAEVLRKMGSQKPIDTPLPSEIPDPMMLLLEKITRIEQKISLHVMGPTDTPFDINAYLNWADIPNVVGARGRILTYPIPVGQRMIVQQYTPYASIDNDPPNPQPIVATHLELVGFCWFEIKLDGKTAFHYYFQVTTGGLVQEGNAIVFLTENLDEDPTVGTCFIGQGGQTLTVDAWRTALNPPPRDVEGVGMRLRGYFSEISKGRRD